MKLPSANSKSNAGAALMLALWALFLLSAMVISWALDIDSRLTLSGNADRALAAEAMASSGAEVGFAEVALHPRVTAGSPNLRKQMGDREGYDVRMSGECGRLNLNLLAPGGVENPALVKILRQYLNLKGIDLNDLDVMIDSLLDWVSPTGGLHHLNACPESDDYHPAHAQLASVDELKKICGWAEFTSKPGWDQDFTVVDSSCNHIDLAWASRDVLRALGFGDDLVDRFLQLRRGPDGIDGTADDAQFIGLPDALTRGLGLNQQQSQLIQAQAPVGFNDQLFRIVSVGRSGDVKRSVEMVVQQTGEVSPPKVISWKEL